MNFNKDDINYAKSTIKNYFYAKKKEMENRRLAFEWESLIDDEREVSGISYEQKGNGCSASYPKDSYINQLIKEQAIYDLEANRWQAKKENLNKVERVEERLAKISLVQRKLILAVCRDGMRNEDVSKQLYNGETTHQTVSDRLNVAIMAFLER